MNLGFIWDKLKLQRAKRAASFATRSPVRLATHDRGGMPYQRLPNGQVISPTRQAQKAARRGTP